MGVCSSVCPGAASLTQFGGIATSPRVSSRDAKRNEIREPGPFYWQFSTASQKMIFSVAAPEHGICTIAYTNKNAAAAPPRQHRTGDESAAASAATT